MIEKELQTVPLVLDDTRLQKTYVIMFAPDEGAKFECLICSNEDQADIIMREYESTGAFTINKGANKAIIKPVVVLKLHTLKALRKEVWAIRVDDLNV